MFGLLRPRKCDVSQSDRREFQRTYCNLCGTLSQEYGVTSRFLVLFDFASLAWLFSSDDATKPFPRLNCVRGGTRFRRDDPDSADRFLAAISAFTCGVKLRDDDADEGSLRARFGEKFYRTTFAQSERNLETAGFDVSRLREILCEQQAVEERWERSLDVASCPTGKAYGMVARHLAQLTGGLPTTACETIGEQIGRVVFLADAYRDVKKDAGESYNPLTDRGDENPVEISSRTRRELFEYVVSCVERVDLVVAGHGPIIGSRWRSLRSQVLALFGLKATSVQLNFQCCIPCGDCFVVADSDECLEVCAGCCFLYVCGLYFCQKGC